MSVPTPTLDDSVRLTDDGVAILDRRTFPLRTEWVVARDAAEVADALRLMVTQSSGQIHAALTAMRHTARTSAPGDVRDRLAEAADLLAAARPTNNHVRDAVAAVLAAVAAADAEPAEVADTRAAELLGRYRERSRALAEHTVALLDDGARVLTHCWMDTYLVELVRAADEAGKRFAYVATETRPYLQGARLTAHTLAEMGQDVTLVTDGMGAAVLSPRSRLGRVDALVTAADRVSMDGHVFNKVGTLGLAVAAHAFGVPFYALVQAPDPQAATASDVVVEEREGDEVLHALGERVASPLVTQAYYPAFDVTPPEYVTRVVTDRGAFPPTRLAQYDPAPRVAPAPVGRDEPLRVVVDTDTGIDDALALLYLAGTPGVEIAGITSVFGNCRLEDAVRNIGYVLDLAGLPDVPVAVGADRPIDGEPRIAAHVHGRDGLGDLGLVKPEPKLVTPPAADYLVELANAEPGRLDLLVLGPVTNVGLALAKDPDLLTRFRSVVLMGGSGPYPPLGVSQMVDANVHNDAEAARRLFAAPRNRLVMVGVNVTAGTIVDEHAMQLWRRADTPWSRFVADVSDSYMDFYQHTWGRRVSPAHDGLAAGVLVHPEYVTASVEGPVNIVSDGFFTRARLMRTADGLPPAGPRHPAPPTTVVTGIDREAFLADFVRTLAATGFGGAG